MRIFKSIWNRLKEKYYEIKMYWWVMRNSKGMAEMILEEGITTNKKEEENDMGNSEE